jgi:phthiocerol/phenolphthiocerol synthesis type-I polyketide synthase E
MNEPNGSPGLDIAVVGLAGRFPRARNVRELWDNLKAGVESISSMTDEELAAAGVGVAEMRDPNYVRARGIVDDSELFDASLFGFSPREARIMDPQQRVFLECAWEALDAAACDPERFAGSIGVYAGTSQSSYAFSNLLTNPEAIRGVGSLELHLGNDKDFLAALLSYRLNLQGPSITVSTACSTSLVAVHLACQALLNRECDLALAGGVSIRVPQKIGYRWEPGGIASADGHCRAFDAAATGSVAGNGAGIVALKRLDDALADGSLIHAVIRGSAVNNDGSLKIGFTAPSVEGQAAVITEAQAAAGVDPESISYVEAHGSGTRLGDPVEVRALTRAFRAGTEKTGFCALGSIKSNIGHLDAAAGVTGLIKTVLALEHRTIPPSLHYERANPEAPFEDTPFFVADRAIPWPSNGGEPRRAGVNSFGMGGTNAHVVLEEAPERRLSGPSRPWQVLVLSAASAEALESVTDRLADHLESSPEDVLADVAYTAQTGRRALRHRRALVCRDREDAVAALESRDAKRLLTSGQSAAGRPVAFLLPGVGDHYPGMARGLYEAEEIFHQEIDRCARVLRPLLGLDLREVLFTGGGEGGGGLDLRRMLGREGSREAAGALDRTAVLQPAVFAVEYALAKLWESWGVAPRAMLGYSLGEYVAACLAGVFSLEDALRVVAERARLLDELPPGAMLSVPLAEERVVGLLGDRLSLAAVNAAELCVVAGPVDAVEELMSRLAAEGIAHRRLPTSHAFHSAMVTPAAERFARFLAGVEMRPPRVPFVTNVTGTWITETEATDPAHWVRHMSGTVRFAEGLRNLWSGPAPALLEVGPGQGLSTLALQQGAEAQGRAVIPSLRPVYDRQPDLAWLLGAAARLWLAGVDIDWQAFHGGERRNRVELPAYPFQRQRYWVEPLRPETRGLEVEGRSLGGPAELEPMRPPATSGGAVEISRHPRPDLRNAYVAPRTPIEVALAHLWQDLLGVEPIGAHDSFFDLGGHSLLAPRLLLRVQRLFGVDVPLAELLAAPTVAELAESVERQPPAEVGRLAGGIEPEILDLRAEAVLDPGIRPESATLGDLSDPAEVMLTGVTGFLGGFLLRELAGQTRARIHCLVRGASAEEGWKRIRENLAGLRIEVPDDRIVPVLGDLALPRWGLSEEAFRALAERVEAVYHCGAWVNFTYPYRSLKPANVLGTEEALRLAAQGRAKPLHFVSTLAVFGSLGETGIGLEDSALEDPEGLHGGYPQSKWVAEKLVALGRERGLAVTVHRPGAIAGDARLGVGNPRDLVWSFLKGCLEMQAAPEVEALFDPIPVDYLARAVVHLSRRRESLGQAFHYFNRHPIPWREVFLLARSLGYPVRLLPPAEWHRELAAAVEAPADNALTPFWPMLRGGPEAAGDGEPAGPAAPRPAGPRFDDRNTVQGLAGSGIVCPPADRALFEVYFAHFLASGFLPPPVELLARGAE